MYQHDAAVLALRALLNCVVREYADLCQWSSAGGMVRLAIDFPLSRGGVTVPVVYRSATGHHLFGDGLILRDGGGVTPLGPLEAIEAIVTRLATADDGGQGCREVIERALSSRALIETTLTRRSQDLTGLVAGRLSFIETEQGLLAGHGIHPCPKSRDGMDDAETIRYAPELAGSFPLHWFAVERPFIRSGASEGFPAADVWLTTVLRSELLGLRSTLPPGDFVLLPAHPWQARHMRTDPAFCRLLAEGRIRDCGEAGEPWFPTSSVRTVYRPDVPFMLKLSLGVGITNSVRINLFKELLRGDDMVRFRQSPFWRAFARSYPGLELIADPAYLAVENEGAVLDGLSLSMRENPFFGPDRDRNVSLLAALCEALPGRGSRVGSLIRQLARRRAITEAQAAEAWFSAFLRVFVRPVIALYLRHGIALEAHQQNVLLEIENDLPIASFYRDNQGFFHHTRGHAALADAIPGLGENSHSVFDEEPVDERLLYYAFINSTLGMIGAIGREGLAPEPLLLGQLREELLALEAVEGARSKLVRKALAAQLSCKANLRTRLAQMDELIGPVETQSIYRSMVNPMLETVPVMDHA